MRIAVVGAHGTGKTTLVRELARYYGYAEIEEASRVIARAEGLEDLMSVGANFQWACLQRQHQVEADYQSGFVSDRGYVDYMAYWIALLSSKVASHESVHYYRVLRHFARDAYDLVVRVPVEVPLEADGFRDTDREYQAEIDELIASLVMGVHACPVTTVTGSVQQRLEQVVHVVADMKLGQQIGAAR